MPRAFSGKYTLTSLWLRWYYTMRWHFNMVRYKLMGKLHIGHVFYRKIYSGCCVCTHDQYDHHGNMVLNVRAYAQTGESRSPGECEHYGSNECTDWHCVGYHDMMDPREDPYPRASDPSRKVGGCPDYVDDYQLSPLAYRDDTQVALD